MRTRLTILCLLLAPAVLAQPTVAPTPEQAGSPRGDNTGDYNVTQSFETGYRFASVSGNDGTYRADVNYGNGIRLLGSSLFVNSRDGHGHWFDQIVLTTSGLGNDPYQSVTLHIEKNKLYKYDLLWRLDDYFNPDLVLTDGLHLMNTSRHLQDHNLTLLPQSKIRFLLGYSRNTQSGPALSTVQLFTQPGATAPETPPPPPSSDFPVLENVRIQQNEFRLGGDLELAGFKLTLMHAWVFFKNDSGFEESGAILGDNPVQGITLNQFQRSEPNHGSSPYWLGNLTKNSKWAAVNGRIVYVDGKRNFILNENALGITPMGAQNQQVFVGGDAARPSLTGDLAISLFPTPNLTLVNNTSVDSTRIDGTADYGQFDLATQTAQYVSFRYLGIRTVTNFTDLHYRFTNWFSVYGGYHYSDRRIKDIEQYAFGSPLSGPTYEQVNLLQSGLLGIRLKPIKAVTINLESEIGRGDRPFTPVSDGNYHALGGRVEYRVKNLALNAGYKENYNNNSVSLTAYSSHSRDYTTGASWTPHDWFTLDATYSKLHLDSLSGILFFAGPEQLSSNQVYISNIHAANLGARFVLKKRVDLYVGYNITRDTGDGRANPASPGATDPVNLIFTPVQTFPLNYQSPQARVSIQLRPKLRWNAGWQFYNYHEDFGLLSLYQGYHANTGYTSLTWAF
jgi:predicted porin